MAGQARRGGPESRVDQGGGRGDDASGEGVGRLLGQGQELEGGDERLVPAGGAAARARRGRGHSARRQAGALCSWAGAHQRAHRLLARGAAQPDGLVGGWPLVAGQARRAGDEPRVDQDAVGRLHPAQQRQQRHGLGRLLAGREEVDQCAWAAGGGGAATDEAARRQCADAADAADAAGADRGAVGSPRADAPPRMGGGRVR